MMKRKRENCDGMVINVASSALLFVTFRETILVEKLPLFEYLTLSQITRQ